MKTLKFLILTCVVTLSACSFNITKDDVDKAKEIFSEQLDNLYQLYEKGVNDILPELSVDKAESMINDALAKIPAEKKELVHNGIKKGVALLDDGKEILVNELSMHVSLEGMQEEIEAFLESLSGIDARISVGDVKIEKTDDNYKLDCTINFFYSNQK